jgi:hypothetical protein
VVATVSTVAVAVGLSQCEVGKVELEAYHVSRYKSFVLDGRDELNLWLVRTGSVYQCVVICHL